MHKAQSLEGLLVASGLLDVSASNVAVVSLPDGHVVPQVGEFFLDIFKLVRDGVLRVFEHRFVLTRVCSEPDLAGRCGSSSCRHGGDGTDVFKVVFRSFGCRSVVSH